MASHAIPTKQPTSFTKNFNKAAASKLPFHDKEDFENAQRGFIGTIPSGKVARSNAPGILAWNLEEYKFVTSNEAPESVSASLWRQAQLNCINGLFKVTDKVYQVRGFDLSNMTIIEGDTGLIIIDPLTTIETSKAALDLYYAHFPFKPIVSVMITHSHIDHFGGIRGIVDEADVKSGKVSIISPEGFLEHAISENIFAGNAMRRRAQYMYGVFLPKGEKGQVDAGLGKSVPTGNNSLIPPTEFVSKTGETRRIDGVDIYHSCKLFALLRS
jgi:alkyl sulfatase BDS1-like metallo-beta-lactamase superfamily hydrolase